MRRRLSERDSNVDMRTARLTMPLTVIAGTAAAVAGSLAAFPQAATTGSAVLQAVPEAGDVISEAIRSVFVDKKAEAAMKAFFPGTLSSAAVDHKVRRVLYPRGFTPQNTLFATSTCPDEVNSRTGELVDTLKERWGENFLLGGLGGVPFTGKAGFSAYAHHVPATGKLFVLFAPHVGIERNGKVGALRRLDQNGVSTSCGAAVGAYNFLKSGKEAGDNLGAAGDTQINFIKKKLSSKLANVDQAPNEMAFVTYQMYSVIRDFFVNDILPTADFWDDASEIVMLGGIMVNRAQGGDRFMPLLFQSRTEGKGSVVDLYEEAFGPLPDLEAALGSRSEADAVLRCRIDKSA